MVFSFTLLLGLFLLAPGFAVFAGLYHGSRLGTVESQPPPPGSILALSIVTVGALTAHTAGALVFWLQDLWCSGVGICLAVDGEANVYSGLFNLATRKAEITGREVLATLAVMGGLTALSFVSARKAVGSLTGKDGLQRLLYGWLADIDVPRNSDEFVLAYVISDVEADGAVVGYEGVVANLTTNAEKEITSVLLENCETFYLRVGRWGVRQRQADRAAAIPTLYLDRSRIRNIAFERLRFADDEIKNPTETPT